MTIKDFLNSNMSYTLDDIKDFMEDIGNFESVRDAMNKATGFEHSKIDLCSHEKYTNKQLLSAEIIDEL